MVGSIPALSSHYCKKGLWERNGKQPCGVKGQLCQVACCFGNKIYDWAKNMYL